MPVRVPLGLKSSPSSVTHRVRTSLWKARDLAVAESYTASTSFTQNGSMQDMNQVSPAEIRSHADHLHVPRLS